MKINKTQLRIMGISGLSGGLILFAGDMLFYYDPINTNIKLNMGNASDFRILLSGISALFASWFYLFALGHVYYAFKPAKSIVRNIVIACFAGILIAYGIVHAAYIAIAVTAKLAVQNQLDIETATALATKINQALRIIIYPIFAVLIFPVYLSGMEKKNLISEMDYSVLPAYSLHVSRINRKIFIRKYQTYNYRRIFKFNLNTVFCSIYCCSVENQSEF